MKTQANFSIFQRGSMSNRSISTAFHRIYIKCSSGKCLPCIFVYFENFYIHLIWLIVFGHRWYDIIFHRIADIYFFHFCGQFITNRSCYLFYVAILTIIFKFFSFCISVTSRRSKCCNLFFARRITVNFKRSSRQRFIDTGS